MLPTFGLRGTPLESREQMSLGVSSALNVFDSPALVEYPRAKHRNVLEWRSGGADTSMSDPGTFYEPCQRHMDVV